MEPEETLLCTALPLRIENHRLILISRATVTASVIFKSELWAKLSGSFGFESSTALSHRKGMVRGNLQESSFQ
jgi:hypothetical protein